MNYWIRGEFVSIEDILSHSGSHAIEFNLIMTWENNVPNEFRPNP